MAVWILAGGVAILLFVVWSNFERLNTQIQNLPEEIAEKWIDAYRNYVREQEAQKEEGGEQ